MRFSGVIRSAVVCVPAVLGAVLLGGVGFIVVAVIFGALTALGVHDVLQRRPSILRSWSLDWERADPDSFVPRLGAELQESR